MTRELRLSTPLTLLAREAGQRLPTTFAGVAYTGGLVPSYNAVIDLTSTTVPKTMAMLSEHQRDQIVGKVDSASIRDSRIVVAGHLYSDIPGSAAEKVAQLGQRGFPFQLSVGLFGFSEEAVPPGRTVRVNGTTHAGPITVLRGGNVRECSVVTLGADPNTSVQLFRSVGSGQGSASAIALALALDPRRIYARRQAATGDRRRW